MPRPTPAIPADLQELSGRFEDWRRTRRGKLPIPEPLWAAAAELARSHSVCQTAQVLRERTRAGLAHARQNGKRLGRPATAAVHAAEIRKLHRAGVSKSEIARCLNIGRTSVRRVLA